MKLLSFFQLRNSFLVVIALIQALLISLSILFVNMTVELLDKTEDEKYRSIEKSVYNSIHNQIENPKSVLVSLLNNKAIVSAFAKRDRRLLLKESNATWEHLKSIGFKQLQFHIPEGSKYVTFLRVHQPENFGEDLSYRPTVLKANIKNEMISGLEQGKSGYGFRVVAPVSENGKHLGSVEIGSSFGDEFLSVLNADFSGSWAIYNFARGVSSLDDRYLINSLGKDKDGDFQNLMPDESVMKKAKNGEMSFARDRKTNTATMYVPLKNFQGDYVLLLKHVAPTNYFKQIQSIFFTAAMICLIGLILSSLIIYVLHRVISNPINKLAVETQKIRDFQLDDEINYSSSLKEMKQLIESTKSMKAGLQSFKKYVPAQLVRQLIETKQEATIGGQRKNITVFFSDVADFTSISESLTPNELTEQLSEYLSVMTEVIIKYNGTVDKYIGDAVMAFWGAPLELKNHAELACRAALECQKRCAELNKKWQQEGKKVFYTRIGINSGEIIVGNMGSEQRLNYTIIGDEVNLASRLEGLNKSYSTATIISQNTVALLPDDFALRLLDFVIVKGKSKPVSIYELVAEKGDIKSMDLEFVKNYNESISLYKERSWNEAIDLLQELAQQKPQDKATQILINRCYEFQKNPPPEKWRGEFVHTEK